MTMLAQLTLRTIEVRQDASRYHPPDFVEIPIEENQRVVSIEWRRGLESPRRKTVDWTASIWIEARV